MIDQKYYDKFDPNKKYKKIFFKPNRALTSGPMTYGEISSIVKTVEEYLKEDQIVSEKSDK